MKKLCFLILLGSTFIYQNANSQVSQDQLKFISKFKALEKELPRERIYLHTDRDSYYLGDRIWFSAYVQLGSFNMPSDLSKVLYVELYEPEGKLLERVTVEIEQGRASGNISFTEKSDKPGIYKIKAYTAWALNFGPSYVFQKNIEVRTGEESKLTAKEQDFDVQFMPEGGILVAGLPTRLAFKSIGTDGLGKDIHGVVYREGAQDSIPFSTAHLGMGVLEFTPQQNGEYYAEVNGKTFPLPEVVTEGTLLSVNDDQDQFSVNVLSNSTDVAGTPLLFAHVRGEVFSAELVNMQNGKGQVFISKAQLPTGVVHFTLLNQSGLPVAERLAFNKNEVDELEVSLSLSDEEVGLRDRIDLGIRVASETVGEFASSASISIYDDSIDPFNSNRPSIVSRLYLESELEGHIEHPGFYFSDHSQADEYLDILMMTQGWRAYDMSSVLEWENIELYSFAEQGFRVSGRIISGFTRTGSAESPVMLSMGGEKKGSWLVTSDEEGYFVIDGLKIYGNERVEIKANDRKGSDNIVIEMDDQFSHLPESKEELVQVLKKLLEEELIEIEATGTEEEELFERAVEASKESEQFIEVMKQAELDEITVTSNRIGFTEEELEEDYLVQMLKQSDTKSAYINLDEKDWMKSFRVAQILDQLPGVRTVYRGITPGIEVEMGATFNNPEDDDPENEPLYFLDGIEVGAADILSLHGNDIKTIGVMRSSVDLAMFGSRGANGVIVVSLKKGGDFNESVRGLIQANLIGYQLPSQFYSPRYGVTVPSDYPTKDNRITLHWESDFEVTGSGSTLSFWANDVPSTYRIIVEGITETGIPFFETQTFTITE
ncbi:MAG: hypothetical protein ED557_11300 [Balneola sp.]|nr:MAG: hypothetical protein ED557_11300 [Balneola sp.]